MPTTHMLPPHIKRKKCKKKFYSPPLENTTHREKREKSCSKERKEKGGEGRRKTTV